MITVKAILPKLPDYNVLVRRMVREMQEEGKDTERQFDRFFASWDEIPTALTTVTYRNRVVTGHTFLKTDEGLARIIRFVIYGTEPHPIYPRGDYPLRYPGTFTAKTQPGVIDSRSGGKSGEIVQRWFVEHPGTRPRGTLAQIDQERRQRVRLRLAIAMREGLAEAVAKGRKP